MERDYQTFGQNDNVETYIGLLDFKKRYQLQNQQIDQIKQQLQEAIAVQTKLRKQIESD